MPIRWACSKSEVHLTVLRAMSASTLHRSALRCKYEYSYFHCLHFAISSVFLCAFFFSLVFLSWTLVSSWSFFPYPIQSSARILSIGYKTLRTHKEKRGDPQEVHPVPNFSLNVFPMASMLVAGTY